MSTIEVYTDGSFSSKTKRAGIGIAFPEFPELNLGLEFKLGERTNQRAELYAVQRALEEIRDVFSFDSIVKVYTDSKYTIGCLTIWCQNWKKNGWKNAKKEPVMNMDIICPTLELIEQFTTPVQFYYVAGHAGVKWNEVADELSRRLEQT